MALATATAASINIDDVKKRVIQLKPKSKETVCGISSSTVAVVVSLEALR